MFTHYKQKAALYLRYQQYSVKESNKATCFLHHFEENQRHPLSQFIQACIETFQVLLGTTQWSIPTMSSIPFELYQFLVVIFFGIFVITYKRLEYNNYVFRNEPVHILFPYYLLTYIFQMCFGVSVW